MAISQMYEQSYHEKRYFMNLSPDEYILISQIYAERCFGNLTHIQQKKVFEYGLGAGQNIYALRNKLGYDISEFALSFCRNKGIPVVSSVGEVPTQTFDIVLSSHNLEHLENPFENLKYLNTRLVKNGYLFLILPKETHYICDPRPDRNQHLFCWNFRSINNLLSRCGFTVSSNEYLYPNRGLRKLRLVAKIDFCLYKQALALLGRMVSGPRELKIVAKKCKEA